MRYKAPRGTHDLWGKQAEKLSFLEQTARDMFKRYNFSEIRLPSFEDANLFIRSIGEATDIVEKEMYVFADRKGRKLALRPEGTASVVRSYIENQLSTELPLSKIFYMGSMFRYERPQAGRYREFFQIGAEYFSNPYPTADAEIIILTRDLLWAAGIKELKIHIHSLGCDKCRPAFRKALIEFLAAIPDLCSDCVRRIENNPLRVLDCKVDSKKLDGFPKMLDFLCAECADHFKVVLSLLESSGCSFYVDSRLVRGLDYYNRTIFEVRSSNIGSQDALAAGGRYDNLVKELGGAPTPAFGFALGSERVLLAAENSGIQKICDEVQIIFIAVSKADYEKAAFELAVRLKGLPLQDTIWDKILPRAENVSVEGPIPGKSLKSQFRLADKIGASKVIIFGEEEFKKGKVVIRDMKTKDQEEVELDSLK